MASKNYVNNGDFNTNTDGWDETNAILASIAGGQVGNCLRVANGVTIGAAWQQLVMPAGTYHLKMYAKAGTAACHITIASTPYDYAGSSSFDSAFSIWTLIEQDFTIMYDNPYINLWVNDVVIGATALYDEVEVTD
jgi:hypothetical protein